MKASEVETELLIRTVRYLISLGISVIDAIERGWLLPKFKAKALKWELNITDRGSRYG